MSNRIVLGLILVLLALPAWAGDYRWTGPAQANWSDPANWDLADGTYPDGADDRGIVDTPTERAVYDAAATGLLGNLSLNGGSEIVVNRDLLLDYTGSSTDPGMLNLQGGETAGLGFYPQAVINTGYTLSLTTLRISCADFRSVYVLGNGTMRFAPDADGKGYMRFQYTNYGYDIRCAVDLSALSTIVVSNAAGTGMTTAHLYLRASGKGARPTDSFTLGRTDGGDQAFAAPDGITTRSNRRIDVTANEDGYDSNPGPRIIVNAVGTDTLPNKVILKRQAWGGFNFTDSGKWSYTSGWIESAGAGVARLVLEGDFRTNVTNVSAANTPWNLSQIQLQMAAEITANDDLGAPRLPSAYQQLQWQGADRNAGGTLPYADPDYFNFLGFTGNRAARKLVVGGDGGLENYINFKGMTVGTTEYHAMYTWGLEFKPGGYLYIEDADDYVYWLSASDTVGGANGAGLALPPGTTLADFTNRPENIRMVGRWPGDANLDLTVDYLDLGALAGSYRQSGKTWAEGDFTGDGSVDYLDLGVLAGNYRSGPTGYVPEPLTLCLLALTWPLLRRRK